MHEPNDTRLVIPTPEQLDWHAAEIGVIIHFDMFTFQPSFIWDQDWDSYPPVETFNPDALDVRQWLTEAKTAGANYAVMVAKHCSGFCLWPTAEHDYHIGNTPYRDGQGDIIREFFDACKALDIRPGLYYSTNANTYLGMSVDRIRAASKAEQDRYHRVVLAQLRELWTNYGEVFEIWFDGGIIPVEEGGPDIASLLLELQPQAVVFQGPPEARSLIRWIGNERAEAPFDCSAIIRNDVGQFDGTEEVLYPGDTHGDRWCPGEADTPNRDARRAFQGGWFWREGEEDTIFSGAELFEKYLTSVGRNANFLIGMGIDRHGRFPVADTAAFRDFADRIAASFSTVLASAPCSPGQMEYRLPVPSEAQYLVLAEDIAQGERVTRFTVAHRRPDGSTQEIFAARIIGNKRIIPLADMHDGELTVTIEDAKAQVQLKTVELY